MRLSSVEYDTALRSRVVSSSTSFRRFTCSVFSPPNRPPPIIRHLAHPDLSDCVHHVLTLRDQNIDLPQLRDDLFRLVSLPCHCSPPGCQRHTSSRTTSMGVDHGGGGGGANLNPLSAASMVLLATRLISSRRYQAIQRMTAGHATMAKIFMNASIISFRDICSPALAAFHPVARIQRQAQRQAAPPSRPVRIAAGGRARRGARPRCACAHARRLGRRQLSRR